MDWLTSLNQGYCELSLVPPLEEEVMSFKAWPICDHLKQKFSNDTCAQCKGVVFPILKNLNALQFYIMDRNVENLSQLFPLNNVILGWSWKNGVQNGLHSTITSG